MAWEIDADQSQAGFSVRQLMASHAIRGRFKAVRGYLHVDEQTPAHSWVDVEVDATSLDTGDEAYDGRLRSQDILDVAEYPTITFKSVRVDHVVSHEYKVSGELTVHGVTKLVTFDADFQEPSDSSGARHAALTARTTINCGDFGVPGATSAAAGHIALGELARIEIDLDLVSRQSASQRSVA